MLKKRLLLCSQWVDRYRSLVAGLLDAGRFEIYCEDNFVKGFGRSHPDLKSYQSFIPPANAQKIEVEARRRLAILTPYLGAEARRAISDSDRYSFLRDDKRMASELLESTAQVLYMNEAFEHMVRMLPIDLLITDGPGLRQQTWLGAARWLGIPSLEIYHATLAVKPELILLRNGQADYLALGSELIKDIYLHLGIPAERMRVTGLPSQPVGNVNRDDAVRILSEKYGIDPQTKFALLFNQYDCGDAFEFLFNLSTGYQVDLIRQLCRATKALNSRHEQKLQLLVKRHPTMAAAGWDDEEAYRYIAEQEGQKLVMISPQESNPLLLAAADAVLAFKVSSTVSESLSADRPVIMWPYCRDWLHDEILNSGSIIPVDDQKSQEEALDRCLYDEVFQKRIASKRRNYLAKFPHVKVSEVVGNLIRYIDDILEGREEGAVYKAAASGITVPSTIAQEDIKVEAVSSANNEIAHTRPIRVLHITDCLSKGGAGRGLIGVAKYSSRQGNFHHECISVNPLFDGVVSEGIAEGLKVYSAPGLDEIRSLMESADVVHWHWWQDFPLMREKLPRKPTIVWCAVSGEYPPNELTREVVDFADVMVITTPLTRDMQAIRSLPEMERQRKVRIILESPDFERILPIERIPHDSFNVGWIGDICAGRYNRRFVDMCRQIAIPKVRFMLCGEGPLKQAAIQETVRLGVQDRFQFLGYQNDMRKMFGLFDLYGYVLDEKTYAGGELNLQEAMAAALPIVILPYGGMKWAILHNYNGLVAYSEKEYREYVEYLYYHPEERERLGNNARDYVLREFGAEKSAAKFNRLYLELAGKSDQPVAEVDVGAVKKTRDAGSYKRLALFHQGKGDVGKAVDYAGRYLKEHPDDPEMLRLMARLQKADPGDAIETRGETEICDDEEIEKRIDTRPYSSYRVTAIVSTYASADVIEGCLLDLFEQTLYKRGELEIIIVDSASPEIEWTIIEKHLPERKHVLAIRTRQRESLYQAWNRALKLARGEYITNANADDRHRRDALEVLAEALDEHPEVAVCYGDVLKTHLPGETFERNTAKDAFHWGEYSREKLESYCCIGPQPMWRRSLHGELGYFDERYRSAGDYDFWLRISLKYPMLHVDQMLGLYLDNPESLEHKGLDGQYERIDVLCRHYLRKMPPPENLPPVSIIIPTFNRPHLLKYALQSLIDQTYANWEALVINDGGDPLKLGTNGLPDDKRIRIINLSENHERSYCRNLGIREACGKYIAFLDDDDIFYRHHLEIAVATLEMKGEEGRIVFADSNRAWVKICDDELRIEKLELVYRNDFDRDRLLVSNYIPILALVFRREVFESEEFDEEMNVLEDLDLLIRLSQKYDFKHLKVETNEFRVFSPLDPPTLERHRQNYLKLYDRYSHLVNDSPELIWGRNEHLRSIDIQIFKAALREPSCTLIIDAGAGKDALMMTLNELGRKTDYRNADLLIVAPQSDVQCMEILSKSAVKNRIVAISPEMKTSEALRAAAEKAESELLVFLDAGCIPAKPDWLLELVKAYCTQKAGIVSGMTVDGRDKTGIWTAPLAYDEDKGCIKGLFVGTPFQQAPLNRIQTVGAVGPGIVLLSKADFLEAGGLDPSLSKVGGWVNLCAWMRQQKGKKVAFNPFAIGISLNSEQITVESDEYRKLQSKWGEDFLRAEEESLAKDDLVKSDEVRIVE